MQVSHIISDSKELIPFMMDIVKFFEEKGFKLSPYPKIVFSKSDEYLDDLFGKTGWYQPDIQKITIITAGRHPKDILRTFTHELIHHNQNVTGKFDPARQHSLRYPMYAHNDEHFRKMEMEAYLYGSMLFREWEDINKAK